MKLSQALMSHDKMTCIIFYSSILLSVAFVADAAIGRYHGDQRQCAVSSQSTRFRESGVNCRIATIYPAKGDPIVGITSTHSPKTFISENLLSLLSTRGDDCLLFLCQKMPHTGNAYRFLPDFHGLCLLESRTPG